MLGIRVCLALVSREYVARASTLDPRLKGLREV